MPIKVGLKQRYSNFPYVNNFAYEMALMLAWLNDLYDVRMTNFSWLFDAFCVMLCLCNDTRCTIIWLCHVMELCCDINVVWCMNLHILHYINYDIMYDVILCTLLSLHSFCQREFKLAQQVDLEDTYTSLLGGSMCACVEKYYTFTSIQIEK